MAQQAKEGRVRGVVVVVVVVVDWSGLEEDEGVDVDDNVGGKFDVGLMVLVGPLEVASASGGG